MVNNTVVEMCPNCNREIKMVWNIKTDGYKAFCPHCGNRLMLCDECRHPDGEFCDQCDYNSVTDTCKHSKESYHKPRGPLYTVVSAHYYPSNKSFYTNEDVFDNLVDAQDYMFQHIKYEIDYIGAHDFVGIAIDEDGMGALVRGKTQQARFDIREI